MKIGIYVGSFNPPHKGHIKIVNHLINKYLDKVIIIPTGNYWDKKDLVNIDHRINMLKLYENENITIDTENNDVEYTYQILENLSEEYKNEKIYLIMGADNIVDFDKWKNYKEILNYNLIIIERNNIDVKKYLEKLQKQDKYILIDDLPNIDISSTMIRDLIKEKECDNLSIYLDNKVYEYIKKNKLYER